MNFTPLAAATCDASGRQCWTMVVGKSRAGAMSPQPTICLPWALDDRLDALDELDELLRRELLNLVAADVKVRSRRQRADFPYQIGDESVRDFLLDAESAEANVDAGVQRRRLAIAVQFRIRRKRSIGVARHVDLRHDGDEAILRVLHEVGVLLLRVVATRSTPDLGAATVFRQIGPGLHLDSPPLVV